VSVATDNAFGEYQMRKNIGNQNYHEIFALRAYLHPVN
jgi:hypothetical protein